jgi:uncharacterized protein YjiS (DUF1127 family)
MGGEGRSRRGRSWPAAVARSLSRLGDWIGLSPERQVRAELADLSDHLLRDIGLSRDDVDRDAASPVWRP